MKNFGRLFTITVLLISSLSFAERKGGGGYDFEDGKKGQKILMEAVQSALSPDGGCKVKLIARAIGATIFESPEVPVKLEAPYELSAAEMACWKLALEHLKKYNESLETIFKTPEKK